MRNVWNQMVEASVTNNRSDDVAPKAVSVEGRHVTKLPFAAEVIIFLLTAIFGGWLMISIVNIAVSNHESDIKNGIIGESVSIPMGNTAQAADGMSLCLTGVGFEQTQLPNEKEMLVVRFEAKNKDNKVLVLKDTQFTAIDDNGRVIEPYARDYTPEGSDVKLRFTQFRVSPAESVDISLSFLGEEVPNIIVYEPYLPSVDGDSAYLRFEIEKEA